MADCPRTADWAAGFDGCNGCWLRIFEAVTMRPGEKIMPQPEFCQDAAFVAFTLDARLEAIRAHTDGGK